MVFTVPAVLAVVDILGFVLLGGRRYVRMAAPPSAACCLQPASRPADSLDFLSLLSVFYEKGSFEFEYCVSFLFRLLAPSSVSEGVC